ncbi:hypothetical protein HYO48_21940 [Vibrio parahaemolyticus]|uniref:hypothetical protein n=1 Tax=Vibrio diabolicus TaxID=50719 RepID=UPI00193C8BC8|nr:hypothetical protein [Vibrio parahaemolyticus]HDY7695016.1 hypothetical protein [Vibrio vulnificus]EJG1815188.1 hypothetical protein [Vibrio parahaemolyticus]EJO4006185.1 hypothetical protein [Vibrio parahaemolyticus]MBE3789257.1 hypothetical protein [Vibrio parahaemolyticus]
MNQSVVESNPFYAEISALANAHNRGDYFKVIMLAPQLLAQIGSAIAEVSEGIVDDIVGDCFSDDDKEVYRLMGKFERELSDKAYIASILVGYYESEFWSKNHSKREFIKYFTKLEDLVDLRNLFAHEYYQKPLSDRRVKNGSKSAMDLLFLFANHEYLEPSV